MKTFVVIATHGRESLLARTLASLASCRQPPGFSGTVVVENGGKGSAAEVVRNAPPVLRAVYLFEPEGRKTRALNRAIRFIDDGLAVFLDDDVRVSPSLLESYATAAQADRAGFFGGPVEAEYEEAPPAWLMPFLPLSARGWHPADPSEPIRKPMFLGFNWAAFSADLNALGGFDESLGPGSDSGLGDESDMQRRLMARGLRPVYVADALVHHWVPRNRCSPEWALERARRSGLGRGLARRGSGLTVAGYPLYLVKGAVASWLRMQLRRGSDRRERFAAEFVYQKQRGRLDGALLRGRNSERLRSN